jgi:hypothetical protein
MFTPSRQLLRPQRPSHFIKTFLPIFWYLLVVEAEVAALVEGVVLVDTKNLQTKQ